jgi:3-oxoacyl-[acyl-carrier-protein] synthase II
MPTPSPVAVTSLAVHVPGYRASDLPGAPAEPAPGPDTAHTLLGRKGLLTKEPATRLALCAVHTALGLPPGRPKEPVPSAPGTAVVVASNLGNVATVCSVVDQMRAEGGHSVSLMDAPNASSNIIASSIAIRYGLTGPNFLVCSGATAGLDAVRLGALLVGSGRTHRAVVVGVEPDDEVASALASTGPAHPLRAAAACLVLEPASTATATATAATATAATDTATTADTTATAVAATTSDTAAASPDTAATADAGPLPLGPVHHHRAPVAPRADLVFGPHPGGPGIALAEVLGETYGAHGVLQVALAVALLRGAHPGLLTGLLPERVGSVAVLCGDHEDGYASMLLAAPSTAPPVARVAACAGTGVAR